MKFLEYANLADVEMQLSGHEIGDCILDAKLEAYSCECTTCRVIFLTLSRIALSLNMSLGRCCR